MNSILGALVGDAAGATLEFCNKEITEEMALNAMRMPGGGQLRVGPGQITDDGELTLAAWRALNSTHESHTDFTVALWKEYAAWYDSCPFDVGRTCSLAFDTYSELLQNYKILTPRAINSGKIIVENYNCSSEANGALMRATAVATWIAKNKTLDIHSLGIECAKADAALSHPNIVCQEVNAIYVFAIVHLLRGMSSESVLVMTDRFVSNKITSNKVKQWYFNESLNISAMDATQQIGHVRWGFVLAIYFLRHPEITFEDAIKITLMKGGDTDTNAAIVGGLVAAYKPIPEYMLHPVLEFDCTTESVKHHTRPAQYSVKQSLSKYL